MKAVNNKILVRVNMAQKDSMFIGGVLLSTAIKFEKNYREKSPVIAEVVNGNEKIKTGDIIICHHNHFYEPSPYYLQDDLYSIPFNKTILCKIKTDGALVPVCGNILGSRVIIPSPLDMPVEYQKTYIDRIKITHKGWTKYSVGDTVLCRPNSPYDIVYNIGGVENRVTKVSEDMICGVIENE